MQAMGYRFVRLEDALAGRISGTNNLVLTIDDGNHSVYPMVKHVLAPRRIPAFLFVYPGIIDSRRFAFTSPFPLPAASTRRQASPAPGG